MNAPTFLEYAQSIVSVLEKACEHCDTVKCSDVAVPNSRDLALTIQGTSHGIHFLRELTEGVITSYKREEEFCGGHASTLERAVESYDPTQDPLVMQYGDSATNAVTQVRDYLVQCIQQRKTPTAEELIKKM
mgnify:CR=1 FL=1